MAKISVWVERPSNTGKIVRNIVTLQVERVVARVTTVCSTFHATTFSFAS